MYEDVANSQPTVMMRRKLIRLGQCHVIERCDGSGEAYTISEGSNYFANRFRKWLGMTQAMSYKIYKGDTLIAVAEETQNGFESIAFRNISSRRELASSVLEGRHFHGQYDLWLVDAKKKDADLPAYVSSAATLLYAFFVMHQRGHKIKVDPNGPEGHGGHDGPSFLAATVENATVANVPSEIVGSGLRAEDNGPVRAEVFASLIHAGPSASPVRTWPLSWRLVSAMAVKARHRGPRPAALLLVAPILLLSWACGWNLSFALGVSPRSRPTPQTGGARMPFPDAEAASSSTASFLAVGGLAAAVTMAPWKHWQMESVMDAILVTLTVVSNLASASKRAKLVGRKAEEVEDWSLDSVSKKFAPQVAEIRKLCKDLPEDFDDTKLLRYALQHPDSPGDAAANVKEVLEWRQGRDRAAVILQRLDINSLCHLLVALTGEGAGIVKAAADAIAKARETCLCFAELQWCEFVQTYLAMSCERAAAQALEHVEGNDH
ncbi:elmoC [Symbiodinium sp. CCMP2592]|nr:elmoC [Symbiodinium sp. CCMP2592]